MKHHTPDRVIATLLAAAPVTVATGQELMVVDNTNDKVILIDATSGAVLNPSFIDLRAGGGRVPGTVIQAYDAGNEIWVTDQTADIVHRWSADGQTWLGEFAQGCDNIRGIHMDFGRIWVCNFGTANAGYGLALLEYDLAFNLIMAHPFPGSPFGIVTHNGELLVTDTTNDDFVRVDPLTGGVLGILHDSDGVNGVDFPGQISKTASGNLLTAGLVTPEGAFEYAPNGTQLAYFDSSAFTTVPQGVYELGNTDLVIGAGNGLWRYDRATLAFTAIIAGIDANYITPRSGGACVCSNYCVANPNSTGLTARMEATGSSSVGANNLTLRASRLPLNSFGFFLTSTQQGAINNPGGSQGVLCLMGSIGRYVGAGQIKNSGATGVISLAINLNQHPTPGGLVSVSAGQTWNFTAWYRDANPQATSNFADGLNVVFTQ